MEIVGNLSLFVRHKTGKDTFRLFGMRCSWFGTGRVKFGISGRQFSHDEN